MLKKLSFLKFIVLALVLAVAMSLCACTTTNNSDSGSDEPELPYVSYFRISGPSSIEIELDAEHQIVIDQPEEVLSYVEWSVVGNSVTVSDSGKVSAVALGESTVTATYGKLSDDLKITVVEKNDDVGGGDVGGGDVGGDTSKAISNILNGENDQTYTVRGTVVAYNAQSFLIKDSSGSVLVYMGYTWSADVKIGDVVEVTGKRAVYGLAPQFASGSTYTKIGTDSFTQPTPEELTLSQINAYASATSVTPKYVKITGTLSISSDGKYYNIAISGTSTVTGSYTYPLSADVVTIGTMNGSTVEVEGWVSGVTGSSSKYLNIIAVKYTEIAKAPGGDGGSDDSGSGDSGSGDGGSDSGSTTDSPYANTAGVVINGETIPVYSGNGYYVVNNNQPFFSAADKAFTGYEYSSLDSLGRATGAFARLTTSLLPTDERDSISHLKPTGWSENKSYTILSGNVLYNRSHLLAHSLMSDDVHIENIVAGTQTMNQVVMTTFEDMVRSEVRSGTDVLYRVTPIYLGNNLVCHGILIEAWSVDDNGDSICFNVYLYNVEPGIEIDYSTGANQLISTGDSGSSTVKPDSEMPGDVIFQLGADKSSHNDGSNASAYNETQGSYKLVISGGSSIYTGAADGLGNSCIKMGASSKAGTMTITVPDGVSKVYIQVAGYKNNSGKLVVNGTTHTISTPSDTAEYTVVEVDVSSNKTVTVSTASGGYRVMINTISFELAD